MPDNNKQHSPFFHFLYSRNVPAIIWMLLLIGLGVASYKQMVREALPDLNIPSFYITTIWEGASGSMVEKRITQKIEKQLRGLKGLKKVRSTSAYSTSNINIQFTAESSVPESMQLLQQQVATVQGELPKDAKRPRIEAVSINDIPIVTVTLSGDVDMGELEQLTKALQRELENISGVRKVRTLGLRPPVVHIQLRPERMKTLGISPLLVRKRIEENGADAPWGEFENSDVTFTLKMDGAYDDLRKLNRLFITKAKGGSSVRLEDIAQIRTTYMREKNRASLSWEGGDYTQVAALSVLKTPGRDTIALLDKITRKLKTTTKAHYWPQNVKWQLVGNEADIIVAELKRGISNGWQAMLAVFLVLLLLLTWREALVAAISVPLTFCGTLVILWACGYTFNLLMLIGMVIALGLLVDDFILIMEGMHDALFIKGLDYISAVRTTIRTYAMPSFSGSITTILVFAPLAFISGIDGKFIRVIPVTAAICLIVSYIVSIILGPPLLRFLLTTNLRATPSMIDRLSHTCEQKLAHWLGNNVVKNKKQALRWIFAAAIFFLLSLVAAEAMRTTLYPKEDGRTLGVTVTLPEGTSFAEAEQVARKVGIILQKKEYIEHVLQIVGGKDPYSDEEAPQNQSATPHLLGFGCFLVPGDERELLAYEYGSRVKQELEEALSQEAGAQVYVKAASGGPSGTDPLQIAISGSDMQELRDIAERVKLTLQTISGVYDIQDNIGPARSELEYTPMQEALDHHGLTQEELAGQMMIYMCNEKIAHFLRSGTQDDLDIRLGTWWNSQHGEMAGPKDWQELSKLAIINERGEAIPLHALAIPNRVSAAPAILHIDGKRSVTVRAKLNGIYVPEVIERMRPKLAAMKAQWPAGYQFSFLGEEEADNTYSEMFMAFCASLLLVYAILALLFDSLLYPAIILSTVLFALTGVFFGFMLGGIPFSFSAAIGIVALVGIVVNDAIIVIETIRRHRKAGLSMYDAARNGASDRLRPIISTTVTNFAGLLPLALSDPGWAPICQAIIFGELTATAGAVFLIPPLFVLMTRESQTA